MNIQKNIWNLWLQGWNNAPDIAQSSRESWIVKNPDWRIYSLDIISLFELIPASELDRILATSAPPEALSDLIRFELLYRFGGVWADATTICARPLNSWLPDVMEFAFFAFDRPSPDRLISTWFLAAEKGSYIMEKWREAAHTYWKGRTERDHYFWPHNLFGELYRTDPTFKNIWDRVPKISAKHPFHFGPDAKSLLDSPTNGYMKALRETNIPVFKLTHKLSRPYGPSSLLAEICAFGREATAEVPFPLSMKESQSKMRSR